MVILVKLWTPSLFNLTCNEVRIVLRGIFFLVCLIFKEFMQEKTIKPSEITLKNKQFMKQKCSVLPFVYTDNLQRNQIIENVIIWPKY